MLGTTVAPWPVFDEEEIAAVAAVMRSGRVNYWTGEKTRTFEREFAEFADCSHAVAVANGTLALDLALKGLGIGPGDEVVVTPRTFIASVSCVVNAGATPVFADVDTESGNIAPHTIERVLSSKTRCIIPVHLAGWPCDMTGIMKLASSFGISVIEDCAQAHGARIEGKSVGSFGAVGAWSFCQDKIMSTGGEGGMVTCDDETLWRHMWSFKDHGKDWNAVYNRHHSAGFRWLHESFGTNWRMLEFQAVIGRIQLERMNGWQARRAAIAARYTEILAPFADAVRVPLPPANMQHAWYRFYAYVRPENLKSGWDRDRIIAEATRRGVPLFQGSCSEVYREKAFERAGWAPAQRLPGAAQLGDTSLMLLTHPTLTEEDVARICEVLAQVLQMARS
ncbi:DegT/DnrJ/EryC1/StrS aminotransferase family protein [Parafrankia sp. BMG5.11]|uniref:DegT/DnrJ/EryC1/StrS family aminotransferase n=1 Tax=Parafrankia sp. BMG5.11 TaxID=222540 RepID=UPI00103F9721|nr:DegT/DnrJ/EryC1/StrS aminotransferase family protein [Parafrankia sp. BMG5.11]TCJ40228.1 DegT/DnrJ/EryC1/StrS aminotransferase family protein [Parafrankia sp. BMG5.11]